MQIFNTSPGSWQELQSFVGQLFQECGFETEISKVVDLVRGKKEIDVYARDTLNELNTLILAECKYWDRPVHQDVVHSFRTVISDFGANIGYLISKVGFQSGCFEAAQNTNIKLVTLNELETIYHLKWREEMIKKYKLYTQPLLPYWLCSSDPNLSIDFRLHLLLSKAYGPICDLSLPGQFELGFVKYPFDVPLINDNLEITSHMRIANDRDYFNFCEKYKNLALRHHKILFNKCGYSSL